MKLSVTSYSFGGYMAEDKLGYLGIIDKAAEMGFDGIEYSQGAFIDIEGSAAKIRERAAEKGIEVVALCMGNDFINAESPEAAVEKLKKAVDFAKEMGASMLRHDITAGVRDRKYKRGYADLLPVLAKCTREVTEYAKSLGIKTMTENHGYFSQDANRVEALINEVGSDNFGALVDIGNFMCADEDPAVSVGIMAPYAFHVHAKDFLYKKGTEINPGEGWFRTRGGNYLRGAIIGQGEGKAFQTLGILKRSGYDGYITVEFEGAEDNLKGIRIGKDNVKRFWEMN